MLRILEQTSVSWQEGKQSGRNLLYQHRKVWCRYQEQDIFQCWAFQCHPLPWKAVWSHFLDKSLSSRRLTMTGPHFPVKTVTEPISLLGEGRMSWPFLAIQANPRCWLLQATQLVNSKQLCKRVKAFSPLHRSVWDLEGRKSSLTCTYQLG